MKTDINFKELKKKKKITINNCYLYMYFNYINNMKNFKNEVQTIKSFNKTAYLIIAFHHGLSYISQLAVQYFFKDQLKVEPGSLAKINSIIHIPWACKPLFGLVTDMVPLFGYRRKYYLFFCGLINLLSWLMMTYYIKDSTLATISMLLVNITLSFSSVLGEAIVVELTQYEEDKDKKSKEFVSYYMIARTIGDLGSSYLKGALVDMLQLRTIFFISSFIPLLLIISSFILIENKTVKNDSLTNNSNTNNLTDEETRDLLENRQPQNLNENEINNSQEDGTFKKLFCFLLQKHVLIPLSFIILFKSTPNYSDAFFYFVTNELKITASNLGQMSFCGSIAVLIAIFIYKTYLKDLNFKYMIVIGTIFSLIISMTSLVLVLRINIQYNIPDFELLIVSGFFLSLIQEFILLPILSLACVICPKNLEGTVFSVFMSSLNLGGIISTLNGGLLTGWLHITSTNFSNLPVLILISKFMSLIPLPILFYIDNSIFNPALNENKNEETDPKNKVEIIQEKETKENDKEKLIL